MIPRTYRVEYLVEGLNLSKIAELSLMRFQLKQNDKLVLMSDGIAGATDAEGQLFGFERVHELLRTTTAAVANAAQSSVRKTTSALFP
jgi:serine phosphatase RsbU (regulator of sigma subunit)